MCACFCEEISRTLVSGGYVGRGEIVLAPRVPEERLCITESELTPHSYASDVTP